MTTIEQLDKELEIIELREEIIRLKKRNLEARQLINELDQELIFYYKKYGEKKR